MNCAGPARRFASGCALLAFAAACAPVWLAPMEREHPLAGRLWDARAHRPIDEREVFRRARDARLLILGETHDNPDHHRLQARLLADLLAAGRRPALAMEQFDREHQQALDAARDRGETDPESIANAGRFDRRGWRWPEYRPLVELAAANRLRIVAANLSREDARALMRSVASGERRANGTAPELRPADPAVRAALERDMVDGHCGMAISPPALRGMVAAQSARDAQMAASLENSGSAGAVLIAGAAHARRDRGAPHYLSADARDALLVVAFVEVEAGRTDPREYASAGSYDLIWFTPRAERDDPCVSLRRRS